MLKVIDIFNPKDLQDIPSNYSKQRSIQVIKQLNIFTSDNLKIIER